MILAKLPLLENRELLPCNLILYLLIDYTYKNYCFNTLMNGKIKEVVIDVTQTYEYLNNKSARLVKMEKTE